MRILSIGKTLQYKDLNIVSIQETNLKTQPNLEEFDYIIINGGDGTIRRVVKSLQNVQHSAKFILNPTGSFNVVAKLHKVPKLDVILKKISLKKELNFEKHHYFNLNEEVFLFSAGNMGDLQHIFLAETLRFGILKQGMVKYVLAILFLLPLHIVMTPFMLLSPRKFFIFTPARFLKKFGSFYGEVKEMEINLENNYNLIELDGDIATVEESVLNIHPAGHIYIVL